MKIYFFCKYKRSTIWNCQLIRGGSKTINYNKFQQPPIDTLTGSSWPPPNASNESAKASSPLYASPIAVLRRYRRKH